MGGDSGRGRGLARLRWFTVDEIAAGLSFGELLSHACDAFVAGLVPGLRCADPGLCSLTPLGLTGAAFSIGGGGFSDRCGIVFR